MKLISRRTHGILDYIVGVLLILAPALFGFGYEGAAAGVPVTLGIAALIYSLCTNYELGVIRVIPFPVHLGLDVVSGILLAVSPWLFGFADFVWGPHVMVGLIELGAVMITRSGVVAGPAGPTTRV